MKLGAYIPVGPLTSMSYQYNYQTVLKCLSTYFNKIVLVSNSRQTTFDTIKHLKLENVEVISYENTWGSLNEEEIDYTAFSKGNERYKEAKKRLNSADCDFLILVDINMYITEVEFEKLKNYCNALKVKNELFGWRYRSLQVQNKFSIPNIRHPWIINLKHRDSNLVEIHPDEAWVDGRKFRAERGSFNDAPYYFCDIFPPIMTST